MKKFLLMMLIAGLYSCVDIKPDIKVEQIIDLKIDGENLEGLEGEWEITTDEDNDVITIKIEKKIEEIQ
jgi:hypothetical protein